MATQNQELISETAKSLLEAIKKQSEGTINSEQLKNLSEAFATVVPLDAKVPTEGGRERVSRSRA